MSDVNGKRDFDREEDIRLPARFLTQLVPAIDDLAELKVTAFFLAMLRQKDGDYRYLRLEEFRAEADLMRGLATVREGTTPEAALAAGLQRALERGTIIRADVDLGGEVRQLYFNNDKAGRLMQRRILSGEWRPAFSDEIEILPPRPTVYSLYEENIGILTPMIAEALKEAQLEFPPEWIEDAMRIAVERNVRNWRYIRAVLERWQQEGRSREDSRRHLERHKQYTAGEWKDFIKS